MLAVWKNLYEDQTSNDSLEQSDKRSETRSVYNLLASGMSDKDSSKCVNKILIVMKVGI